MDTHLAPDTHLIARDTELKLVQQRLQDTIAGDGSLVLIAGTAGIGKTSLATVMLRLAQEAGAAIAAGRFYEGPDMPFGLWRSLVNDFCRSAYVELKELREPFEPGPAIRTSYQLMRSIAEALRAIAAQRPCVILLDDLHWADSDSLDVLDLVTRQLEGIPLLIIGTYRHEDVPRHSPLFELLPRLQRDRRVESLSLHNLARDDVAVLADIRWKRCTPQLVDYLYRRSEGNPFFLIELMRDLKERDLLTQDERGHWLPPVWTSSVPVMVRQIVGRRVAHLDSDAEELLRVSAVVGEVWDLDIVEAVLGWPEDRLLRALEATLEANLVVSHAETGDVYRFAHALIRDVLYQEQVTRRRRTLHRMVAEAAEAQTATEHRRSNLSALAYHYAAADIWPKAFYYSLLAGDAARDHFASRGALQLYEQAAEIAQLHPAAAGASEWISVNDRLGRLRLVLNDLHGAESAFANLLETAQAAGDQRAQGNALLWLSFTRSRQARFLERAVDLGEEALRVADLVHAPDLLATAHWNLGRLRYGMGQFEQGTNHFVQAERLEEGTGRAGILPRSLNYRAMRAIWLADYHQAESYAMKGLDRARLNHDALYNGALLWQIGRACGETGRYSEALQALREGLAKSEELDDRHYTVKLLNTLGWLHLEMGDVETAEEYDRDALTLSRSGPSDRILEAECNCLLNLASDRLFRLDAKGADHYLREFEATDPLVEYARFRYFNRYLLVRSEAALARGDGRAALHDAEQAETQSVALEMRKNLAKSWMLQGQALVSLGRSNRSIALLNRSVTLTDELDHGSLRWKARVYLSIAYQTMERHDDAESMARQALELANNLAARIPTEALKTSYLSIPLLQTARQITQHGVHQPTYPAGLTGREVEVLRLISSGATNKEIAGRLHISVKTVNAHLTNIFNKTDSSNRAAAAAFAIQHNLA